jgi:hypothetical protein
MSSQEQESNAIAKTGSGGGGQYPSVPMPAVRHAIVCLARFPDFPRLQWPGCYSLVVADQASQSGAKVAAGSGRIVELPASGSLRSRPSLCHAGAGGGRPGVANIMLVMALMLRFP